MNKRMTRELQNLPGTIDGNQYILKPNVVFQLSNKYPFSPPILNIYSKDHISCLAKLYSQYKPFIKQYNVPMECICCFSVTCSWSPCNTCKDVYDEYVSYCILLKQIISTHYFFKRVPFDECVNTNIASYLW